MLEQLTHVVRGGQYTAPKTILGFLGAVYLLGVTFALGVSVALASSGELLWLIPVILFVVVACTAALIWAVLRLAQKDPTPLVLGQMSGGDYLAHQRLLKMGDSRAGEQLATPQAPLEEPKAEAGRVGSAGLPGLEEEGS